MLSHLTVSVNIQQMGWRHPKTPFPLLSLEGRKSKNAELGAMQK
jgi:hypothetical protein